MLSSRSLNQSEKKTFKQLNLQGKNKTFQEQSCQVSSRSAKEITFSGQLIEICTIKFGIPLLLYIILTVITIKNIWFILLKFFFNCSGKKYMHNSVSQDWLFKCDTYEHEFSNPSCYFICFMFLSSTFEGLYLGLLISVLTATYSFFQFFSFEVF